ncbi:MAG: PepSY-like domain-containing protein [Bacteroidales bacterium]|nr:PepSY-like domain-containing protein [Bacteroidales bacterium]
MKKLLVVLMGLIALGAFVSCDRTVSPDKLPAQAKQFITSHFNGTEVLSVRKDGGQYETVLFDGTELDFTRGGKWIKVDCGMNPLPAGILPANTDQYLTAKFPTNFATCVKYEHKRYEVGLNDPIDVDLIFDANGNFVRIDD